MKALFLLSFLSFLFYFPAKVCARSSSVETSVIELKLTCTVCISFWPRNVVKRGVCYENVCPSVCLSDS